MKPAFSLLPLRMVCVTREQLSGDPPTGPSDPSLQFFLVHLPQGSSLRLGTELFCIIKTITGSNIF